MSVFILIFLCPFLEPIIAFTVIAEKGLLSAILVLFWYPFFFLIWLFFVSHKSCLKFTFSREDSLTYQTWFPPVVTSSLSIVSSFGIEGQQYLTSLYFYTVTSDTVSCTVSWWLASVKTGPLVPSTALSSCSHAAVPAQTVILSPRELRPGADPAGENQNIPLLQSQGMNYVLQQTLQMLSA